MAFNNISSDLIIVIADSAIGIEADKRAGMKVIWFRAFSKDRDFTKADGVVDSFAELSCEIIPNLLSIIL